MAHGYRSLQHWNQWLSHQFLGNRLLEAEKQILTQMLAKHFGKQALLLGVPNQFDLLAASPIPYHTIISPLIHRDKKMAYIEGDFHEIPILTGSIDLVILPHTLEFVDNPRQLLSEACRIIKPEGLIAVCGFNPYSTWGFRRLAARKKISPWTANFIASRQVKNWLQLADFEMEKHKSVLFIPPINHPNMYHKLQFLERFGSKCFPALGGAYVLIARAKVIPLTPIRLKWKQQLNSIRVPTTISGHIARQSK